MKLVEPKTRIDLTLKLATPNPDGVIDRALGKQPAAIRLAAEVPDFLPGALLSGEMARLRIVSGGTKP